MLLGEEEARGAALFQHKIHRLCYRQLALTHQAVHSSGYLQPHVTDLGALESNAVPIAQHLRHHDVGTVEAHMVARTATGKRHSERHTAHVLHSTSLEAVINLAIKFREFSVALGTTLSTLTLVKVIHLCFVLENKVSNNFTMQR